METAEDLRRHVEQLRKQIAEIYPSNNDAIAKIGKWQSEIFVAASQLAEISTQRLVKQTEALIYLTRALVALTAGLLIFTIILAMRH